MNNSYVGTSVIENDNLASNNFITAPASYKICAYLSQNPLDYDEIGAT